MKAFSLANAPHLPVTGESHPLVRESVRRLTAANAVTLTGSLMLFAAIYLLASRSGNVETIPPPFPKGPVISEPPVIVPRGRMPGVTPISDARNAIPEPKPDVVRPDDVIFDDPGTGEKFPGERFDGDFPDNPIVFEPRSIQPPDTIVAFDELPVLLSIGEPIYPDLAKRAGIDGTVLVKVFITRAGKVNKAVAVEGPEVLRNSAVDAAKTALFVPAKQGDTPVDVWVMIPVTFSLNR
jgi:periplasmic protein TonB